MILCIDVGNSHLYGGVFNDESLLLRFRHNTRAVSSDEIGIFLKQVLRENGVPADAITSIALCSVVPGLDYSIRAACLKYFEIEPFVIQSGIKTGLKIQCHNPAEVGADRIANAIAAVAHYPNTDLIVCDFGTASTFCAVAADKRYLGGTILAGLRLSMEALENKTAKLPPVKIIKPSKCLGRSSVESIQSGLYYSALGGAREVIERIKQEAFDGRDAKLIGTGGFANLFEQDGLFDIIIADLVLSGLRLALLQNQ